jgi:hypothetical protein
MYVYPMLKSIFLFSFSSHERSYLCLFLETDKDLDMKNYSCGWLHLILKSYVGMKLRIKIPCT